jgi:hypothetical protein
MNDSAKILIFDNTNNSSAIREGTVAMKYFTADIVIRCSNGIYTIIKDRYSDRSGTVLTQEELDILIITEGL